MSFVAMLKAKYDSSFSQTSGIEILVKNIQVKRLPKISELTVVSLKNMPLATVGKAGLIGKACPMIKELDISNTKIRD